MAAASGLDKFRFVDDLSRLDSTTSSEAAVNVNGNQAIDRIPTSSPSCPNTANAAAAAAAAASRLLSLQRDLGCSMASPADFLRHFEATSRSNAGFDRLASLASFGFPGLTGLPPLTPLSLGVGAPSDDQLLSPEGYAKSNEAVDEAVEIHQPRLRTPSAEDQHRNRGK
jgi:hypothetical protein